MKTLKTFIIGMIVLTGLFSCNRKEMEDQINRLETDKQELTAKVQEKDSTIKELISVMDEIESSLKDMAKRQKEVEKIMIEDELPKGIDEYINEINEILGMKEDNYQSLKKRFAYAKERINRLKVRADTLDTLVSQQKKDIQSLKKNMYSLQDTIQARNNRLHMLDSIHKIHSGKLAKWDSLMHQGKFYVGQESQLLENGYLVKKGGFLGLFGQVKVLNPNFSKTGFRNLDVREKTSFTFAAGKKDVSLKTNHPEASYQLMELSGDSTKLKVEKPTEFWEVSDYLLVSLK